MAKNTLKNLFPVKDQKELGNSISQLAALSNCSQPVMEMFKEAEVDPASNAVMLSVEECSQLASIYWKYCQQSDAIKNYDYRARKKQPQILKEMFDDSPPPPPPPRKPEVADQLSWSPVEPLTSERLAKYYARLSKARLTSLGNRVDGDD